MHGGLDLNVDDAFLVVGLVVDDHEVEGPARLLVLVGPDHLANVALGSHLLLEQEVVNELLPPQARLQEGKNLLMNVIKNKTK